MKPAGVHHVAICVAGAQKGLAFYRDVLGMTQLPRPDLGRGYWLDAGGLPRGVDVAGECAGGFGVEVAYHDACTLVGVATGKHVADAAGARDDDHLAR